MVPIERNAIFPRLNGIAEDVAELRKLGQLPREEFIRGPAYKLAHYHLHRALEGVFRIGNHILARIPGGAGATQYREVARLLGEKGIVPKDFADTALVKMAGYRVRLVHFYAGVTPEELSRIVPERLDYFEIFRQHIVALLEHPDRLGLSVE